MNQLGQSSGDKSQYKITTDDQSLKDQVVNNINKFNNLSSTKDLLDAFLQSTTKEQIALQGVKSEIYIFKYQEVRYVVKFNKDPILGTKEASNNNAISQLRQKSDIIQAYTLAYYGAHLYNDVEYHFMEHADICLINLIMHSSVSCGYFNYDTKIDQIGQIKINTHEAIKSMVQIVAELHCCGVAHRDIKPDNFLFSLKDHKIKICDFEFAVLKNEPIDNKKLGTIAYAAPELWGKQNIKFLDLIKMDVWSLGITIYAIITKKVPLKSSKFYLGSTQEAINKLIQDNIKNEYSIYVDLLMNMLTLNPDHRCDMQKCNTLIYQAYCKNGTQQLEAMLSGEETDNKNYIKNIDTKQINRNTDSIVSQVFKHNDSIVSQVLKNNTLNSNNYDNTKDINSCGNSLIELQKMKNNKLAIHSYNHELNENQQSICRKILQLIKCAYNGLQQFYIQKFTFKL